MRKVIESYVPNYCTVQYKIIQTNMSLDENLLMFYSKGQLVAFFVNKRFFWCSTQHTTYHIFNFPATWNYYFVMFPSAARSLLTLNVRSQRMVNPQKHLSPPTIILLPQKTQIFLIFHLVPSISLYLHVNYSFNFSWQQKICSAICSPIYILLLSTKRQFPINLSVTIFKWQHSTVEQSYENDILNKNKPCLNVYLHWLICQVVSALKIPSLSKDLPKCQHRIFSLTILRNASKTNFFSKEEFFSWAILADGKTFQIEHYCCQCHQGEERRKEVVIISIIDNKRTNLFFGHHPNQIFTLT